VQSLLHGAKTATCYFAEEPGCFRLTFDRAGSDVRISVDWDPEDSPASEEWQPRFEAMFNLVQFAKEVDDELDRNLLKWGSDGYEVRWGYRFPSEAHGRLRAGLLKSDRE
jgi:hypothetical protein